MTHSPEEVMEELKQHTCLDCDGHGEVLSVSAPDDFETFTCRECDNGFI